MAPTRTSRRLAHCATFFTLAILASCDHNGRPGSDDLVDQRPRRASRLLLIIDYPDDTIRIGDAPAERSVHVLNPYGFAVTFTAKTSKPVFELIPSSNQPGCSATDPSQPITLPAWGCAVVTIKFNPPFTGTHHGSLSLVGPSGSTYAAIDIAAQRLY